MTNLELPPTDLITLIKFSYFDIATDIQAIVEISTFPFDEVEELREKYTYNIAPWTQGIEAAKKGLRILYR